MSEVIPYLHGAIRMRGLNFSKSVQDHSALRIKVKFSEVFSLATADEKRGD